MGSCATGILWHSTVMASIAAAPIAILLCSKGLRRFYFIMKDGPQQSGLSAWVIRGCLRAAAAAAFRRGAGLWGASGRRAGRSLWGWMEGQTGQGDGVSGAVPKRRHDLGLGCAQLGGSRESLWPQAIKSALPLIQGRLSGLIAVKNSSNSREDSARQSAAQPGFSTRKSIRVWVPQTLFPLSKPHPHRGLCHGRELPILCRELPILPSRWGHSSGSLVGWAGPRPVT